MDDLTDLEHIRKRASMYIGDKTVRGLHHLFHELLDNSIDQFLAGQVTSVTVSTSGSTLEFSDDGPGLPFNEPHENSDSLATHYLTELRRDSPTADGHVPHVHLGGWGCGLRIVTALSATCDVTSRRVDHLWRQSFTKGVADGSATAISQAGPPGTTFHLTVDRDIFSDDWCQQRIDRRLKDSAFLFPGFRVQSPNFQFTAPRGLADLALQLANETSSTNADKVWWFNESTEDMSIQAAIAGTTAGETEWRAFANGSTSYEQGTHLTALQQVVAACDIKPAIALIHVVMNTPRFAGPTRTRLDVPEILTPIVEALKPSLSTFVSNS